ncbi:DnaJ-like protein subfamily C member [Hyalella azteca]|uniref:DnaJ homolog subfamily C member 3 n=1 Tax=Hyalella azteca TaxID=294128 RepID=A0A6A0H627_HYAAZ|nr:dnaJ homolog subfamily C member 3 [Hyalella azteca]KAA0199689.1 DnaJ-like protein subfamily C member [Hyalella azteca]
MYLIVKSYQLLFSVWIFFASIDPRLHGVLGGSDPNEVQRYLELGVQMLARGQLHDALAQFHAAIDGDPNNYLSYYRRATVFLALGRARSGLQDLDKVLLLKPDLTNARLQRASVHYKMAELDLAHIDLEEVLRREPDNVEANELYARIEPLKQKMVLVQDSVHVGDYHYAIPLLKDIVDECPWASWVREQRIAAFEAVGDLQSAITDLRVATKLTSDNTEGFLHLANLYYRMGDVEHTLGEIRECLKLDPDHKNCFAVYKKVKKVNKLVEGLQEQVNNKQFAECSEAAGKILKEEPDVEAVRHLAYEKLCICDREIGEIIKAKKSCDVALQYSQDPRLYCERAELHIVNDDLDAAAEDYQQAQKIDENFTRAKEGMQRVQKLKKQAGRRDYYKILGVKRTATKREITKAYRQMAQKWHPDHFDGDEKEMAEKKFIDIAAAKEVLTDDEMRRKFDSGEDPLDPEQQQQSPFRHGFNPFQHFQGGGGPFQFKFHF